jgi:hypothetical protein
MTALQLSSHHRTVIRAPSRAVMLTRPNPASPNEGTNKGCSMRYEIRMRGEWTAHAAEEFADVTVRVDDRDIVVAADVDQAGLHGLLERIRTLGYELVDVRRSRSTRRNGPR